MRGRKGVARNDSSKKQEINGDMGKKAHKVSPPGRKEERFKWKRRKGACTTHAINFLKRHKLPLSDSFFKILLLIY